MKKEDIIKGILYLIIHSSDTPPDRMGWTFLEINNFLKTNQIDKYSGETKESWIKLKKLIIEMESKDLLEERHFDSRVDYSIENKGIELIEKDKSLKDKWKVPD